MGHATLEVRKIAGASAVTGALATHPLKLLTPVARGPCVWAYTSSLGGGVVAGDQLRLGITVDEGARCFLGTQSSTKIYRNPERRPCGIKLAASVGPEAMLALLPEPMQCFTGACFVQEQTLRMAPRATLVLLDWLSGGRTARGERWAFSRYRSRIEILRAADDDPSAEPRRVLRDALDLDNTGPVALAAERMDRFNCLALLVLLGPLASAAAGESLARIAAEPVGRRASLLQSVSPLAEGALIRLAGEQLEDVAAAVRRHLSFLPAQLGDDPWARKG